MKCTVIVVCLLSIIGLPIDATPIKDCDPHEHRDRTQADASKQIKAWQNGYNYYVYEMLKTHKKGCTLENMLQRQEWGSMSPQSRKEYIRAVKCLQAKPPRSSKQEVPGARTRYDDFSAQHIKSSPFVHFSGLFFHFHRYLLYTYEKALRDECGYNGAQPYWDWTLSWEDPRKSTVFDGSPTSMGGNGAVVSHNSTTISAFGITLSIPPATGGGCISGPFSDYTVNLGPVAFTPYGPNNGLGYNPRCLSRDLSPDWTNNTKPTDIVTLVNSCTDLGCFDRNLEALDGVHAGGHFGMGGLGLDAYASPGDPAFWLHHAMVDKVWSLWQGIDPENRVGMVYGTETAFNVPPSPDVTWNTTIDYGVLASSQKVGDLVSTISGPFCYTYV